MTTPLEAIKVALEALEPWANSPFLEYKDWPDDMGIQSSVYLGDLRRARAAHALLSQVEETQTPVRAGTVDYAGTTREVPRSHSPLAGPVQVDEGGVDRPPCVPAQVPSKSEREAALEVASHVFDMIEPYLSATVSFGEVREVIIKAALASLPPKPDKEPS